MGGADSPLDLATAGSDSATTMSVQKSGLLILAAATPTLGAFYVPSVGSPLTDIR